VNERNVTWSDSTGRTQREDTSEVAEIKERYRGIRAKVARRTQNDRRAQRQLLSKYGRREKDRTTQRIHRISKKIVERAEGNQFGIVMEKLKGIRKLYRKGNGQGRSYRGRMNSWTFREFQRQVEYKAAWAGIPVTYVSARGTSSKCPDCGSSLIRLEGRKLMCPSCRQPEDRDAVASKSILARVVPRARPGG
jgi:putative transposase